MIGELCALGCAAAWASSTVIIKTQTQRLDPVVMNAFRSVVSALVFVVLALATGAFSALAAGSAATGRRNGIVLALLAACLWSVSVNLLGDVAATVTAVSALVGSVGGSLLFVAAVKQAGPAKAAILNSAAPLFSLPMAFVVLM